MRLITTFFVILLTLWYTHVLAATQWQVELNDGSIISGEIVSLKDGVYTIYSNQLGTLEISHSNIRAIHSETSHLLTDKEINPQIPSIATGLQALQGLIMNSPETLETLLSLRNNPDVQATLQDQKVMDAVKAGDLSALIAHPIFGKIVKDQRMKKVTEPLEVE